MKCSLMFKLDHQICYATQGKESYFPEKIKSFSIVVYLVFGINQHSKGYFDLIW